ncbi:hypothetical protein BU17DRAFT_64254 [Hysterangium stoloniferum]|nr:hypothetical protein BU17DRAFT_64254 [Hysterangium stoloniferum]
MAAIQGREMQVYKCSVWAEFETAWVWLEDMLHGCAGVPSAAGVWFEGALCSSSRVCCTAVQGCAAQQFKGVLHSSSRVCCTAVQGCAAQQFKGVLHSSSRVCCTAVQGCAAQQFKGVLHSSSRVCCTAVQGCAAQQFKGVLHSSSRVCCTAVQGCAAQQFKGVLHSSSRVCCTAVQGCTAWQFKGVLHGGSKVQCTLFNKARHVTLSDEAFTDLGSVCDTLQHCALTTSHQHTWTLSPPPLHFTFVGGQLAAKDSPTYLKHYWTLWARPFGNTDCNLTVHDNG